MLSREAGLLSGPYLEPKGWRITGKPLVCVRKLKTLASDSSEEQWPSRRRAASRQMQKLVPLDALPSGQPVLKVGFLVWFPSL